MRLIASATLVLAGITGLGLGEIAERSACSVTFSQIAGIIALAAGECSFCCRVRNCVEGTQA